MKIYSLSILIRRLNTYLQSSKKKYVSTIIIYIYIYKTEAFEAPTIFHVIIIFKILALKNKNSDFNNYFSPILLLLLYKNPINSFSFPIFPSSPFFCVYSSFASLAFPFFFCHWCPKPKEIKSLRFFSFLIKLSTNMADTTPSP